MKGLCENRRCLAKADAMQQYAASPERFDCHLPPSAFCLLHVTRATREQFSATQALHPSMLEGSPPRERHDVKCHSRYAEP